MTIRASNAGDRNIFGMLLLTGKFYCILASRKRFIGTLTGREKPSDRVFGTAATVALCAAAGVSIVRVHDVAAMCDVVRVTSAVLGD